jgi:hypothetical protein
MITDLLINAMCRMASSITTKDKVTRTFVDLNNLLGVGCLGSSYVALRDPASSPVIPGWSSDWEESTAAAWQCCAWMRCGLLSRRRFRSVISASPTFPCCSVQPLLAMRSRPPGEITFDSIDMGLFETRVLVRISEDNPPNFKSSLILNTCLVLEYKRV